MSIHFGQVTPYGDIYRGQHWFKQAIPWVNVNLSTKAFYDIHRHKNNFTIPAIVRIPSLRDKKCNECECLLEVAGMQNHADRHIMVRMITMCPNRCYIRQGASGHRLELFIVTRTSRDRHSLDNIASVLLEKHFHTNGMNTRISWDLVDHF